jgi:hypothetical protein
LTPNLRSVHFFTGAITLLGAIFKACPDDSRLEYITIEGYGASTLRYFEFDVAIDSAAARLRFLKMIEIKWMVGTAGFHTFTKKIKEALPSLVRRGMLRVGETQCMEFFVRSIFPHTDFSGPEDDAHYGWE